MPRRCFECDRPADVEHHVVPRSRGGTKTVPLCERCHSKAHGRLMTTRALTTAALAHKKAKGERVGRVPFGYTLAADGVQLVPHAAEQAVLVTIRELRAAGETLRSIAAELDRRGVATKNGKPWSHSTIQAILERAAP